MTTSIYGIPIKSTIGVARHYFLANDGTFENAIEWTSKGIEYKGKSAELTLEQEQRIREYPEKFRE
ncbi:MAG: hypothetical protein ACRC2R_15645 [Xenococcaceae cyanobacterium]